MSDWGKVVRLPDGMTAHVEREAVEHGEHDDQVLAVTECLVVKMKDDDGYDVLIRIDKGSLEFSGLGYAVLANGHGVGVRVHDPADPREPHPDGRRVWFSKSAGIELADGGDSAEYEDVSDGDVRLLVYDFDDKRTVTVLPERSKALH